MSDATFEGRQEQARRFRTLHADVPLVLPNAWDPASAVAVVSVGAQAVATTSAGVCWSRGAPDGERIEAGEALDALAAIVRAVDVPVTADIESGYGSTPDDVAATVEAVITLGAVGINIEDSPGVGDAPLRAPDIAAERIQAVRLGAEALGADLWINARTDPFLAGIGSPKRCLDESLERAERYRAAGADSIFVPGALDPEIIAALVQGPLPLNVMAGPGAPSVKELASLGVTRISVGAAIADAAYGLAMRAARELLGEGTYTAMQGGVGYVELNSLLDRR